MGRGGDLEVSGDVYKDMNKVPVVYTMTARVLSNCSHVTGMSCKNRYSAIHFEDMEGLKLNVPAAIPQHLHHEFEVVCAADVA